MIKARSVTNTFFSTVLLLCSFLLVCSQSIAQNGNPNVPSGGGRRPMGGPPGSKPPAPYVPVVGKEKTLKDGFKMLASGLEYKIYKHGTGTKKAVAGDFVEMNIKVHVKDSVIFDSRKMYNNKPVPYTSNQPRYKGDVAEVFMFLVAGDSAVVRIPVDTLLKAGNTLQPWMKAGDKIIYNVSFVNVLTPGEKKIKDSISANKQKGIDDSLLQDYFKKNNIKPLKTETGLYYTISKEGTGDNAKDGWFASINYTGKFLDGKTFDSNTDTAFKHKEPFTLEIGKGKVIKGWDQGLKLLKKGSVAKLYIPSTLAYGSNERGGIPANSIMIFDIEVVDMYNQPDRDDELIKDYIAKNHLDAKKTASGLYYVVFDEGKGDYAKAGNTLSMDYNGKLLNGKAFDGNTDSTFHHKEPFNFELGKGKVIKGWDEGLTHFKKGGKGLLLIPSGLAYGAQNKGPNLPANSVLVFDIEVLDIVDKAELENNKLQKYLKDNNINAQKTASGLYYKISSEGAGERPTSGQKVVVNYTGTTIDGKKFDSNLDTAFHHVQPFSFTLGKGQVIKGWEEGIALLKKGAKATLYIPSYLAYGEQSPTPAISPNSTLIFDVELVDIQQ